VVERGARAPGALAVLVVLGAVSMLVAGCGKEPVSIPILRLTAGDQAVCQRVVDALPDKLAGEGRRKLQPAEALAGAWGDPPMVVQCGAGEPAGLTRTSACTVVDGVGWFVPPDEGDDSSADAVLTTVGFRPSLQLTVPAEDRGAKLAAAEVELAPIVKQYLRVVRHCQ
jgi:hypothetical protein